MSKAQATGTHYPTTARSILAALILATAVVPTPAPATASSPLPSSTGSAPAYTSAPRTTPQSAEPATTTITGGGTESRQLIHEITQRFDRAGLTLPGLRIHIHESYDGCGGHQGLYGRHGDLYRVDICNVDAAVIGHEFAHAWEHHNVADATREAFMGRLGIELWNDPDAPAPARAMEKAAWLIEWGTRNEAIQPMLRSHYADDLDNFELMTGTASPRIADRPAAADSRNSSDATVAQVEVAASGVQS